MSPGSNPARSVSSRYARRQISTLRAVVAACPASSNAITTAAAPYRCRVRALSRKSASPSFRLIEFTTGLPCTHFSPASMTDHFELSIITGTRAISGSVATRLRNRVIVCSESSSASSMLTSIRLAPPRTWSRATSAAAAKSPDLTRRAKRADPVTLVRSPTIRKAPLRTVRVSSPLNRLPPAPPAGRGRGGSPSTARAMAAMWSGVVPQQPPRALTNPLAANSRSSPAVSSGVSSYSPKALGSPAFG